MIYYKPTDDTEFRFVSESARNLKDVSTDEEMLLLYGLYKQALYGNIKSSPPFIFTMKERKKWIAWKSQSGKGSSKCKKEYINLVYSLQSKYNINNSIRGV
jgi:diazepam-binding inhibitor (GABA receptor modulating acyl-CoA-binding protein)